jgi:hypothetical protein
MCPAGETPALRVGCRFAMVRILVAALARWLLLYVARRTPIPTLALPLKGRALNQRASRMANELCSKLQITTSHSTLKQ